MFVTPIFKNFFSYSLILSLCGGLLPMYKVVSTEILVPAFLIYENKPLRNQKSNLPTLGLKLAL